MAVYNHFAVSDESNAYQLSVGTMNTEQSTVGDGLRGRSYRPFTTNDDDHNSKQPENCARQLGGGFWYGYCVDYYNAVSLTAAGNKFGWQTREGAQLLQQAEMYACK